MNGCRRCWVIGIGMALVAAIVVLSQVALGQDRTPHAADPVAEACAILQASDAASTAFPGARRYLCGGEPFADTACSSRQGNTCTRDFVCKPQVVQCKSPPCRPVVTLAGCGFAVKENLAQHVRQFGLCQRSGGVWRRDAVRPEWIGGPCACTPSDETDARNRPAPDTFYVRERGCVSELTLCKDHGGRWIESRPEKSGSRADVDPHAPAFRAYCEVAGAPAQWGTLEPRLGFPPY